MPPPTVVQAGSVTASINPEGEGAFRYMIGAPGMPSLYEVERVMILLALRVTGGNKTHAARFLGITPRTLRSKVKDLDQQGFQPESYDPKGFYGESAFGGLGEG